MDLTEDAFRALARSSPWLWTSLHFTRHAEEFAEAWIQRPGRATVRDGSGRVERLHEKLGDSSATVAVSAYAEDGSRAKPPRVVRRWFRDVEPTRRPDGLVEERPDEFGALVGDRLVLLEHADPMYGNYQWVAMLDPVELSAGTAVAGLEAGAHRGRTVWRADVKPLPGYAPTCGCCALLWSEISDRDELDDYFEPGADYPDSYLVTLDVETGVVVELLPVRSGRPGGPLIDLEIHEVDRP